MKRRRRWITAGSTTRRTAVFILTAAVVLAAAGLLSFASLLQDEAELETDDTLLSGEEALSESAPAEPEAVDRLHLRPVGAPADGGAVPETDPSGGYVERYREQLSHQGQKVYDQMKTAISRGSGSRMTVWFTMPMNLELAESHGMSASPDWKALLADLTTESAEEYLGVTQLPLDALVYDSPELAWVLFGEDGFAAEPFGYQKNDMEIVVNGLEITPTAQEGQAENSAALQKALESLTVGGHTRYDKVKSIRDELVASSQEESGSYGEVVDVFGRTTGGYAKAFKLICDREGIPSALVVGEFEGEPHLWNYVLMSDGSWYGIDPAPDGEEAFLLGASFLERYHPTGDFSGVWSLFDEAFRPVGFAVPELAEEDYQMEPAPLTLEEEPLAEGEWVYGEVLDESGVALTGGVFQSPEGEDVAGALEWTDSSREEKAAGGAGVQTAHYRFVPESESLLPYEGEVSVHLAPRSIRIASVELEKKVYDGAPEAAVHSVAFDGLLEEDRAVVQAEPEKTTAVFADPMAGEGKEYRVTVNGLTVNEAGKYRLEETEAVYRDGVIEKAKATLVIEQKRVGVGERLDFQLPLGEAVGFLSGLSERAEPGGCEYKLHSVIDSHGLFRQGSVRIEDGVLLLSTTGEGDAGSVATISIQVTSGNFETGIVRLAVSRVGKKVVDFSVPVKDVEYSGKPVTVPSPEIAEGPAGDWTISYSFSGMTRGGEIYGPTAEPPRDAGAYVMTATLEGAEHTGVHTTPTFQIKPREVRIRAEAEPSPVGEDPVFTYVYSGFVGEDQEDTPGLLTGRPLAVCEAGTDLSGSYPVTLAALPVARNYEFVADPTQKKFQVLPRTADSSYYQLLSGRAEGWNGEDIVIAPTGKEGFDLLIVQGAGKDQPEFVYTKERPFVISANGSDVLDGGVRFRLGRNGSGARTEPVGFSYKFDRTPPLITNIEWSEPSGELGGTLRVTATDRLSGIRTISLQTPHGLVSSVTPVGGKAEFPVVSGGDHKITVEDGAGNTFVEWYHVAFAEEMEEEVADDDAAAQADDGQLAESVFWRSVDRQLRDLDTADTVELELLAAEDRIPGSVVRQAVEKGVALEIRWPDGSEVHTIGLEADTLPPLAELGYEELEPVCPVPEEQGGSGAVEKPLTAAGQAKNIGKSGGKTIRMRAIPVLYTAEEIPTVIRYSQAESGPATPQQKTPAPPRVSPPSAERQTTVYDYVPWLVLAGLLVSAIIARVLYRRSYWK